MERKVNVAYLKVGMYVSNLDRPWIDTPFLLEGFLIQSEDDLTALNQYCKYVYIDTDRGIGASQYIEPLPRLKPARETKRRSLRFDDVFTRQQIYG